MSKVRELILGDAFLPYVIFFFLFAKKPFCFGLKRYLIGMYFHYHSIKTRENHSFYSCFFLLQSHYLRAAIAEDALNTSVKTGFSGSLVDLFSEGRVMKELQRSKCIGKIEEYVEEEREEDVWKLRIQRERWRFGYGGNIEPGEPIFNDKLAICSNTWIWE